MHHALHVDEILGIIFNDPILRAGGDRHTYQTISPIESVFKKYPLLSLALTCKTFYEPATRALWQQIDGLDRLVRTMSGDVTQTFVPYARRKERNAEGKEDEGERSLVTERFGGQWPKVPCIVFKKNPTEKDWRNFDRLAAYVQEFGRTDERKDIFRLEDDILQALRARYNDPKIPILPRLRKLTCGGCKQLHYANLLLSKELHTLQMSMVRDACSTCVLAFLGDTKRLATAANLEHIHLPSCYMPLDLHVPVSNFLMTRATTKLKSLYVTGVPVKSDVMKLILHCQALEELTLMVASFDMGDLFETNMLRPNLRKFHIESEVRADGTGIGGELEDSFYSELIRRLQAPNLVDFRFKGGSRHPLASDIKRFLETLSESGCLAREDQTSTVPSIKLIPPQRRGSPEFPPDPLPDAYICTFSNAFHVLHQYSPTEFTHPRFSKLQALDLYEAFVDLSDKELGILGASLPHLKSLSFSTRAYGRPKSRMTLIGFWLLGKCCRNLENISLLIHAAIDWECFGALTGFVGDCDSVDARLEHYARARNANVHALYVGDSTVHDEELAAEFLRVVFPNIWNLGYTQSREETEDMVKWRSIRHNIH